MNPVVVIGAGLAGLSAACYLIGRGYDVTVIEREDGPGGRAGVLHRDGFSFDTGPTVLTMPDLITDAIRAATGDPNADLSAMAAGTPFALAHTFSQTGPFRPSNVERRLPGMFFAGSGTVPGVGVPMVLISGKLAASRVADYLPGPKR